MSMHVHYYVRPPKHVMSLLKTKFSQIPLQNPLSSVWRYRFTQATHAHCGVNMTVQLHRNSSTSRVRIKPYCPWHMCDLWLVMPYHRSWLSDKQIAMIFEYDTTAGLLGCNGRYLQMLRRNILHQSATRGKLYAILYNASTLRSLNYDRSIASSKAISKETGLVLPLSVSSKVTQWLLTSSSSSYRPLYLSFYNMFCNALPTQDLSNPCSLP
jgi:hypothetical protein